MGRRRVARNGEDAEASARHLLGAAAGRLRLRQLARGGLLLLRVPALGMAADVLHRRPAGAPRALCAYERERIRGLGAQPSPKLARVFPWRRIALEALPVPRRPHVD